KNEFSTKLISDFLLSIKVPKSFDEAITFINELSSEMKKQNNRKGVSIEYELYSLSKFAKLIKLDITIDRIIINLNKETISRLEDIFDDLSESK
ncbi:21180_t:CDS:1, partial [Racocetra persica]